ncbi:hypothetical protein SALBM311S_10015 [Streptomyces alboniger]
MTRSRPIQHSTPAPDPWQTPIAGVVLTDAELDHTLGLARFREADGLDILATAPVRQALEDRLRLGEVLGPYTALTWRELPSHRAAAERRLRRAVRR